MQKRMLFVCLSVLVLAMAVSCNGGKKDDLPPAGPAGATTTFDPSKATATVGGKIVFEGTPPANPKIQMTGDPYCASHSSNATAEEILVKDGGLQNVIVYVKSGHQGFAPFKTPTEPKMIDQKDCHYVPHVFTLMTNQTLQVTNSDNTLHNIHGWTVTNKTFNQGQPVQGMKNDFKLDKVEFDPPVPIRCDVHKWMNSYVGVFDHPFHTVSAESGAFQLKLPAGKYEIVAWHEKLGTQTATVEVKDNETKDLSFTFKPAA